MPSDSSEPTDIELLRAVANGDSGAFMDLYDRFNRIAFGLSYRIVGNAATAEEVVQDAFMQVWNRASAFQDRGDANVRGWLLTIVHHRAIDSLRRNDRHDGRSVTLDDALELRALGDVWSDVEQELTATEVRTALETLPEEQRTAIELAYFGGLTQREIAEKVDTPLGTVKGRMRLGLNRLRTVLAPADPDESAPLKR